METISVENYITLLDLYNHNSLRLPEDSEEQRQLGEQIDEVWKNLTDAEKSEIQARMTVEE